jgi:hypothetical protein
MTFARHPLLAQTDCRCPAAKEDGSMNRTRIRLLARLALLLPLLSLASCVVESKNPLSDPDTSKPDRRLFGQWKGTNENKTTEYLFIGLPSVQIKGRPEGIMVAHTIDVTADHKISASAYALFVTTIGKDTYLNVFESKLAENAEQPEWSKTNIQSVLPVQCVVTDDQLSIWLMDLEATAKVVDSGKLKGEVRRKDGTVSSVLLTDTTENLAAYLKDGGNKGLFAEKGALVYSRVK